MTNDVPALHLHRRRARGAHRGAARLRPAPELTQPLKPCYVVAQRGPARARRGQGHRLHAVQPTVDIYVDEILQDQPPTLFDGNGRRHRPRAVPGGGPARVHAAADRAEHARRTPWSGDLDGHAARRSSSRRRARRRASGCASAAAASPRPARPSTRTTCSRARSRKTIRLGMPQGPVRHVQRQAQAVPVQEAPARRGMWTIQFDQHPHYDPKAAVRVPMTIKVRRS